MNESLVKKYLNALGIADDHEDFYKPTIRLKLLRPGAYFIPRPYVLRDGLPTRFGIEEAARKGCVISAEFVEKLVAPTCPLCFEGLTLSLLAENLGGPSAQSQRHLWLCRCCSPDNVISASTVVALAREFKDADQQKIDLPTTGPNSIPADKTDVAADTEREGGESSGELNTDLPLRQVRHDLQDRKDSDE